MDFSARRILELLDASSISDSPLLALRHTQTVVDEIIETMTFALSSGTTSLAPEALSRLRNEVDRLELRISAVLNQPTSTDVLAKTTARITALTAYGHAPAPELTASFVRLVDLVSQDTIPTWPLILVPDHAVLVDRQSFAELCTNRGARLLVYISSSSVASLHANAGSEDTSTAMAATLALDELARLTDRFGADIENRRAPGTAVAVESDIGGSSSAQGSFERDLRRLTIQHASSAVVGVVGPHYASGGGQDSALLNFARLG